MRTTPESTSIINLSKQGPFNQFALLERRASRVKTSTATALDMNSSYYDSVQLVCVASRENAAGQNMIQHYIGHQSFLPISVHLVCLAWKKGEMGGNMIQHYIGYPSFSPISVQLVCLAWKNGETGGDLLRRYMGYQFF